MSGRKASRSPSPAARGHTDGSLGLLSMQLDEDAAASLRGYKYQSENRSVICASPVAQLWETIATFLAANAPFITPNMVTVVGALCSWGGFWCVHIFRKISDDGEWEEQDGMFYVWIGCFVLWSYNTLDNVDGKNRRMGSPLGQMMDHGCDALTVTLLAVALGYGLDVDFGFGMVVWAAGCIMWLCITWEEHYTHILRMEYFAADEAEYGCIALVTYVGWIGGPSAVSKGELVPAFVWDYLPTEFLGLERGGADDGKLIVLVLALFMGVFTSIASIIVVGKKTGGINSLKLVSQDFLPFVIFVGLSAAWGIKAEQDHGWDADKKGPEATGLYYKSLFMMTVSTLFARMAVLIIDATLVKKPIPHLHWETLVPLVGAIASHGDFAGLSVPFFGGGPLHEIGLETVLPFLCVAGWASFLHLLGSLTSAYARALGVTVFIHPDHPTPVDLPTANWLLSLYTGCFGVVLVLHPNTFLEGGYLPYWTTAGTPVLVFYARAFGVMLLGLCWTARSHPTSPAVSYNFACVTSLLWPLIFAEIWSDDGVKYMWQLQSAVHGLVAILAVSCAHANP